MLQKGNFKSSGKFKTRISDNSNKPFKKLLLFLPLIVIVVLVILIAKLGLFEIKNVEVESSNLSCASSEDILNESKIKGQNFLLLKGNEINDRVKKKFICIKEVLVDVYFLSKVKLKVISRQPVFILANINSTKEKSLPVYVGTPQLEGSSSAQINMTEATSSASLDFGKLKINQQFIIDDEGVIFGNKSSEQLPVLYTEQNIILGQIFDAERIKNTYKIFIRLREFGLSPSDAKIYSNSSLIVNVEPKLIFDLDRAINTQLASLQLILEEAKINDSKMEYIDLRFDKPVVKYLPKEKKSGS